MRVKARRTRRVYGTDLRHGCSELHVLGVPSSSAPRYPEDVEESALNVQSGVAQPPPMNPKRRRRQSQAPSVESLYEAVLRHDRIGFARAITLVESEAEADLPSAQELLDRCLPALGRARRVGITGVPGVGKSTFIEAFGLHLAEQGRRVAVLAIDPTSERTGGSILGDKSRMSRLSQHPNAFIRPSPSRMSLGGVAHRTRETMLLCDAAGFDVILVETVGVGQSETAVAGMVDVFLLLALAGAGDELQGIKRGIMEMADLVAITKADGENRRAAELARAQLAHALHFFPAGPSGWTPPVILTSAVESTGIDQVWQAILSFLEASQASGEFDRRRRQQRVRWFEAETQRRLFRKVGEAQVLAELDALREKVGDGEIAPWHAAGRAMEWLR